MTTVDRGPKPLHAARRGLVIAVLGLGATLTAASASPQDSVGPAAPASVRPPGLFRPRHSLSFEVRFTASPLQPDSPGSCRAIPACTVAARAQKRP